MSEEFWKSEAENWRSAYYQLGRLVFNKVKVDTRFGEGLVIDAFPDGITVVIDGNFHRFDSGHTEPVAFVKPPERT